MYTHDLSLNNFFAIRLFADDFVIFKDKTYYGDPLALQDDLLLITGRRTYSKMSLSINECESMCFSPIPMKTYRALHLNGTLLDTLT